MASIDFQEIFRIVVINIPLNALSDIDMLIKQILMGACSHLTGRHEIVRVSADLFDPYIASCCRS